MSKVNSFGSSDQLVVGSKTYRIFKLDSVDAKTLPYSLKILLENLLRTEDGANITADHVNALVNWDPTVEPDTEIQFTPARVIMQDFTGVPCIVDLATMREAVAELGGDPKRINPLAPAELVIDHSVQIDVAGSADAFERNVEFEYNRNGERYQFLRWGQTAFDDFKVVPPGTGIVHQVNIEYLARVVMTRKVDGVLRAYPDTVVGTDSHTTMVNGLGVLGWGVGGIEAEAAMLGQPVSMLIPRVVGFKLTGSIPLQLSTLTLLTSLYLNSNSLNGLIPSQISKLTKLTTLFLNDNRLEGPAGSFLCISSLTKTFPIRLKLRAKITGWGNISSPEAKCRPTTFSTHFKKICIFKSHGFGTGFTTKRLQKTGSRTWIIIVKPL
mgnify:CR=1 FL=1